LLEGHGARPARSGPARPSGIPGSGHARSRRGGGGVEGPRTTPAGGDREDGEDGSDSIQGVDLHGSGASREAVRVPNLCPGVSA
jgi:hypothetical protein